RDSDGANAFDLNRARDSPRARRRDRADALNGRGDGHRLDASGRHRANTDDLGVAPDLEHDVADALDNCGAIGVLAARSRDVANAGDGCRCDGDAPPLGHSRADTLDGGDAETDLESVRIDLTDAL